MKYKKLRYKKQRRDRRGLFLLALLFLFLFPYIVSNFSGMEKQYLQTQDLPGEIWVLQRKIWGYEKIPLEEYLKGMLAGSIPIDYQEETLKAQAIILRTYCLCHVENKGGDKVIWDDNMKEFYISLVDREKLFGDHFAEKEEKIERAVKATKGIIAVWNDKIPELPFCRISNGQTRNIEEYVLRKEEFDYIKTALCPEDKMSENYIQYIEIPMNEFQKNIKRLLKEKNTMLDKITIYRDSMEYVKEIEIGSTVIDGELFKNTFQLASSCFYLEEINGQIQFKTKGQGHGFGFSQYSANQMAKEGNTYENLLTYFFQNIELEKVS